MAHEDGKGAQVISLSGDPVYRYGEREKPFEAAVAGEDVGVLEEHIARHVGTPDFVFHELVSDLVHVDVHHVPPSAKRPFRILVTTGMSDRSMKAPEGAPDLQYAELVVVLPESWPVSEKAFRDEANYWPIRGMKFLARFPHEYDTWLWEGHTVPNGDPPSPFNDSVRFSCLLLAPPILLPQEFGVCHVKPGKSVHFFAVIPLFDEEITLKLRKGSDALFDLFDRYRISELIDPKRRNVGRKWWHALKPGS